MKCRSSLLFAAGLAVLGLLPDFASAGYEAPNNTTYSDPGTYYSSVNLSSVSTLKAQLTTITNTGFSAQTYDSISDRFVVLDADPNKPGNIITIYDHTSISGTWDSGKSYNKEHQWLDSHLPAAAHADYFNLRPSLVQTNSDRANEDYDEPPSATTTWHDNGTTFFAGDADKGDVARVQFYMATKWANQGLTLLNTTSSVASSYQMGNLAALLKWNYEDGVDNFERRRNYYVQSYQKDRNPFVDHPEYVWAIFGGGNNNSKLYVGSAANTDGSSATTVTLGRTMKGGTIVAGSAVLHKIDVHPTTLDITVGGEATSADAGVGQVVDYNSVDRTLNVGLSSSTATTGLKTGTVMINNTDLTSAGTGMGSADGNDVITVNASVLDKRTVTASAVSIGRVITGASVSTSTTLATTGDDDHFTRVNVAATSSAASNGLSATGSATTFNAAASTGTRTITGTLTGAGAKSGSLSLAVTSAENGGAGLTGEGTYSAVAVGYTATVLDHSNASFSLGSDVNSKTFELGSFTQAAGTKQVTLSSAIYDLVSTASYTAGLDLDSITAASGSTSTLVLAGSFTALAAGLGSDMNVTVNLSSVGSFTALYTIGLSDENLTGATAANSESLSFTLHGTVVAAPEPGSLSLIGLSVAVLMRRRRRA